MSTAPAARARPAPRARAAAGAPVRAVPAAAPPRPVPRPRHGRLLAGGMATVLVLALLLGGIVAVNIAALRTSLALRQESARAQELRVRNDVLAAEVTSLSSPGRIVARAERIGMVPATPSPDDYVRLDPRRRPRAAAADARGPVLPGRPLPREVGR